jgi:hypothetical protein
MIEPPRGTDPLACALQEHRSAIELQGHVQGRLEPSQSLPSEPNRCPPQYESGALPLS